uniref:Uncharacterized protein n=1 Tax=Nelumbo nucifera TaxID=4432 RepID=A0A822YLJ8_NELNU|nr:TPA_asm: hypothetical protein HUJ06_010627 [Nelumbo nucifera]
MLSKSSSKGLKKSTSTVLLLALTIPLAIGQHIERVGIIDVHHHSRAVSGVSWSCEKLTFQDDFIFS